MSWGLVVGAAAVALIHTVLGPDHYLPFVMIARARGWTVRRTALVTVLSGLAHVSASIVLAGVALTLGVALAGLGRLESTFGGFGAWTLVALGLTYGVWGVRRAVRGSRGDGVDPSRAAGSTTAVWVSMAVLVLGPCEPLIPLFVLPVSRGHWELALVTTSVFTVVTVGTMVAMTVLGAASLRRVTSAPLERWVHAMAGGTIAVTGLAVAILGL